MLVNFSDDASKKDEPSKESDSTDKKQKEKDEAANKKKEVTSTRLNELLAMMTKESDLSIVRSVVRPRSAAEKKERKIAVSVKEEKPPKPASIAQAAKEVAKKLGGDADKTESELLGALLKKRSSNLDLKYVVEGFYSP